MTDSAAVGASPSGGDGAYATWLAAVAAARTLERGPRGGAAAASAPAATAVPDPGLNQRTAGQRYIRTRRGQTKSTVDVWTGKYWSCRHGLRVGHCSPCDGTTALNLRALIRASQPRLAEHRRQVAADIFDEGPWCGCYFCCTARRPSKPYWALPCAAGAARAHQVRPPASAAETAYRAYCMNRHAPDPEGDERARNRPSGARSPDGPLDGLDERDYDATAYRRWQRETRPRQGTPAQVRALYEPHIWTDGQRREHRDFVAGRMPPAEPDHPLRWAPNDRVEVTGLEWLGQEGPVPGTVEYYTAGYMQRYTVRPDPGRGSPEGDADPHLVHVKPCALRAIGSGSGGSTDSGGSDSEEPSASADAVPGGRECPGAVAAALSRADLEALFSLSLSAACEEVGLGRTVFKKACRRVGIEKWPWRNRVGPHVRRPMARPPHRPPPPPSTRASSSSSHASLLERSHSRRPARRRRRRARRGAQEAHSQAPPSARGHMRAWGHPPSGPRAGRALEPRGDEVRERGGGRERGRNVT